jgi:hypothetical protein
MKIVSSIPRIDGSKFAVLQSRAFTQCLRKIAQHDLQSAVTKDFRVENSLCSAERVLRVN